MLKVRLHYKTELNSTVVANKGLVTNYGEGGGGATKREGGAHEVLRLRKGGGGKSFSHAEGGGGHKKLWGRFYVVA